METEMEIDDVIVGDKIIVNQVDFVLDRVGLECE
jgi:hypothetical protein